MSIYDNRNKPAYSKFDAPIYYCKNKHINKWWTEEHNKVIKSQIKKERWSWAWTITNKIEKITPKKIIKKWKNTDPLCRKYAWYNVLMYFSVAQAKKLGYLQLIRKAKRKKCQLCGHGFIENSIPFPLIKRLGIDNLDFCSPCLTESLLDMGDEKMKKKDIVEYLIDLSKILNRVPSQDYTNEVSNLSYFEMNDRILILTHLKNKPSISKVKKTFGSWFHALIEAQILEDGTRKNTFGIQCLAKDGHMCLSLGEKTIDDLLLDLKIEHSKEPHYPDSNYRGDFLVGDKIIEYFGLVGNKKYDQKIKHKRKIAKKHNIKIVEIFPIDLIDTKTLTGILINKL